MNINVGLIIGDKYRLEHPLSSGGMGSVWVARHVTLGSPVAIKFMAPTFAGSAAFVARFEREARIAAHLRSAHVVHVQDYGIVQGVSYLVMELLQGEDLGTRLQRVGRLSVPEAVRILVQTGRAVRRAHEAGLVHRDLKPGNLFLARGEDNDEEIVKVLDFGIVKETGAQISGEVTRTGEVLGSPHYMSPEQVRGEKDVDPRSDLWSLGVILFRALTGQLPFPGDQLGLVIAKILVDPIPRATQLAPDLPPEIEGFFARALARDRALRFQSVKEMLDELRRIADPHGADALPASARTVAPGTAWPRPDMPLLPGAAAGAPGIEGQPAGPGTLTNAGVAAGIAGKLRPGGRNLSRSAMGLAMGALVAVVGGGVAVASVWGKAAPEDGPEAHAAAPPTQGGQEVARPGLAGVTAPPAAEEPAPAASAPAGEPAGAEPPAAAALPSATAAAGAASVEKANPPSSPSSAPRQKPRGSTAKKPKSDWY